MKGEARARKLEARNFDPRDARKEFVPELRTGDIVIMANLPVHKGPRVGELIEAAGASLLHLPPYRPDFDPIENADSKIEELLSKAAERTVEGGAPHSKR